MHTARYRILSVAACGLIALGAAACGSDEDDSSQDFAAADLEGLNFAADEFPEMDYQPDGSGLGAFVRDQKREAKEEGDRSGLEFAASLQELGLEEDYVSQFFAFERGAELSFVESIGFLFEDAERAEAAVDVVREGVARNIRPAEEIDVPEFGEQAFGFSGEFEGFPTYSVGWRVGDVIQLATVAPGDPDAGPQGTIELAEQLADSQADESGGAG